MPIEFLCGQCGKQLRTPDDTAGKMARCPSCGNVQTIPSLGAASTPGYSPPSNEPLYPAPGQTPNPFSEATEKSTPSPFADPSPFKEAKPNPFAETPSSPFNPYAAPSYSGAFHAPSRDEVYARNKVQAPAIALMATFGIALAISLVSMVAFVVRVMQGEAEPASAFQFLFSLPFSIFVVYGANKMRRLEQHGVAVAAAICAMIPCSGCCILGIPFGIWSLMVLNDSYVRAAFRT